MIKKFIRKILGVKNPDDTIDQGKVSAKKNKPKVLSAKEHGIDPALVSNNAIRITQT